MNPPNKSLRALATATVVMAAPWLCPISQAAQAINLWTAPAMTRVSLTEKPGDHVSNEITIHACRNELESAQVIMHGAAERMAELTFELEPLLSADGSSLPAPAFFQEIDVRVSQGSPDAPLPSGWYPDALVPMSARESVTISTFRGESGDVNLRLWIDCYVPASQLPGDYSGKLLIRDRNTAELIDTAGITVHVFPETLPDKPTLKSYFGLEEHRVARIHGLDREKNGIALAGVMDRYYQLLIGSRLQPGLLFASSPPLDNKGRLVWNIPAGETLPAPAEVVGKYLRPGGGMNCLHLPMWRGYPFADPLGDDREKATAYLAELAVLTRRISADATLFFTVGKLDEPNTADAYDEIRNWASLIKDASKAADTPIEFLVTEQPRPQEADWGSLAGSVDIWTPQVMVAWEDLESKTGKRIIAERIKAGDEVWCYPALAQFREQWMKEKGKANMALDSYPPVWLTDYPAVNYRILPWICAAQGLTGIHYWNAFEWNQGVDPWDDAGVFTIGSETFNGDGLLIYPPAPASLIGKEKAAAMQPCASIRLKWIRDGMEDYEHLKLLENANPEAAADILAGIARGFAAWETSPVKIDFSRVSISEAFTSSALNHLPPKHESNSNKTHQSGIQAGTEIHTATKNTDQ